MKNFYEAIKSRRTYYSIGKEKVVSDDKIVDIVSNALKDTPSAFNSQSSRAVVLLNEHHDKLWDIAKAELKKIVPEEAFVKTAEKIDNCFKSGYATVLYFEDVNVVKGLQEQFPAYKDNFPIWSNHASAMLQFVIWTSLELEGLGASLQHYNPLIDEAVKKEWNIPDNYTLIAQMPVGNPVKSPDDKDYMPIEDRLTVFK